MLMPDDDVSSVTVRPAWVSELGLNQVQAEQKFLL